MKLKKIQNLAFYWENRFWDYYIANGDREENAVFRICNSKKYLIFDMDDLEARGQFIGEETEVSTKMLRRIFKEIERRADF